MHNQNFLNGSKLTAALAGVVVTGVAALYVAAPDPVEGIRAGIRITARTSFTFFIATFLASALVMYSRNTATLWLRRNRRNIGLAFAASHFLHAAAIATLAKADPVLFARLTNPVTFAAGGLAYGFIVAMTITSFRRPRHFLGERAWRLLHLTGSYYIWLSFVNNFGKRALLEPAYWLPVSLLLFAFAVRILAPVQSGALPSNNS